MGKNITKLRKQGQRAESREQRAAKGRVHRAESIAQRRARRKSECSGEPAKCIPFVAGGQGEMSKPHGGAMSVA